MTSRSCVTWVICTVASSCLLRISLILPHGESTCALRYVIPWTTTLSREWEDSPIWCGGEAGRWESTGGGMPSKGRLDWEGGRRSSSLSEEEYLQRIFVLTHWLDLFFMKPTCFKEDVLRIFEGWSDSLRTFPKFSTLDSMISLRSMPYGMHIFLVVNAPIISPTIKKQRSILFLVIIWNIIQQSSFVTSEKLPLLGDIIWTTIRCKRRPIIDNFVEELMKQGRESS